LPWKHLFRIGRDPYPPYDLVRKTLQHSRVFSGARANILQGLRCAAERFFTQRGTTDTLGGSTAGLHHDSVRFVCQTRLVFELENE